MTRGDLFSPMMI